MAGPLHLDPGYATALPQFKKRIEAAGYKNEIQIGPPGSFPMPHTVGRRFSPAAGTPYPLMQLGPGIFATNQSAGYEWEAFRSQVHVGLRAFLASYPSLPQIPMIPIFLELRYINAFGAGVAGTLDIFEFIEAATTLEFKAPSFLTGKRFSGPIEGRIITGHKVKERRETVFSIDIGTGKQGDTSIIRTETKFTSRGAGVPKFKLGASRSFVNDVDRWLLLARSFISPSFKELINDATMTKLREASDG